MRGPTSHRRYTGRDWVQGVQEGLRRCSGGPTSHRKRAGRDGVWEDAGAQEVAPLTEGVQAGQHLGVAVAVEADAADQELLVNLPHHRAGGLVAGHGGSSAWEAHHSEGQAPCNAPRGSMAHHSHPRPQPTAPYNPRPPHGLVLGHGRPSARERGNLNAWEALRGTLQPTAQPTAPHSPLPTPQPHRGPYWTLTLWHDGSAPWGAHSPDPRHPPHGNSPSLAQQTPCGAHTATPPGPHHAHEPRAPKASPTRAPPPSHTTVPHSTAPPTPCPSQRTHPTASYACAPWHPPPSTVTIHPPHRAPTVPILLPHGAHPNPITFLRSPPAPTQPPVPCPLCPTDPAPPPVPGSPQPPVPHHPLSLAPSPHPGPAHGAAAAPRSRPRPRPGRHCAAPPPPRHRDMAGAGGSRIPRAPGGPCPRSRTPHALYTPHTADAAPALGPRPLWRPPRRTPAPLTPPAAPSSLQRAPRDPTAHPRPRPGMRQGGGRAGRHQPRSGGGG